LRSTVLLLDCHKMKCVCIIIWPRAGKVKGKRAVYRTPRLARLFVEIARVTSSLRW